MSSTSIVKVASGAALIASGSFLLGQYIDQKQIFKNLTKLIREDPYAFYLKDKLLKIFQNFPVSDADGPNRMQEILKFGYPSLGELRVFEDYVLSYDHRNRVPYWVLEHLTERSFMNKYSVNRRFAEFRSDMVIPSLFRAHNYDYFQSGFDRGHLAAAANHKGCQFNYNETFFLSNVAPQVGKGFNNDAWNNLEIYVRGLTSLYPEIYVCSGSVYQPERRNNSKIYVEYQMIGRSMVAVPTHFFKIIVCMSREHKFSLEAYLLPNRFIDDSIDLKTFRRPPEEIERIAGLKFFDKIERNKYLSINGVQVPQTSGTNDQLD